MESTLSTFVDAEVRLAETLPGYESRPQQQALAAAIEEALGSGTHLLGQAGCGTGKSLAALIPAILSHQRTVVATATKALQDQIAYKDLPFLAENLGEPFTYALLKGRSNYLCMAAYSDPDTTDRVAYPALREVAVAIGRDDFDGERDNIGTDLTDQEWRALTVTAEECPGKNNCPFAGECYAEKAKARAQEADIVVVNHALLCMDAYIKATTDGYATMLGPYDVLVVDEAHELRSYATNTLTARFSQSSFRALTTEVRNFVATLYDEGQAEKLNDLGAEVVAASEVLWPKLGDGRLRQVHFIEAEEEWFAVVKALQDLTTAFLAVSTDKVPERNEEHKKANARKGRLAARCRNLTAKFTDLLAAPFDVLVRWVEMEERTSRRGETTSTKVIFTAPIDVAPTMRDWFFARDEVVHEQVLRSGEVRTWNEDPLTAVLVSATLKTKEGAMAFEYIAETLGVDEHNSIDVGTPFDFETQSLLYIPRDLPDPTKEKQAWASISVSLMGDLVRASDGRALLLFTSKSQMRAAYEALSSRLPYTCLMQGQRPNKILAVEFMADPSSVLFATRSFFTGVDFAGEACSLVVIDKMPFPVPTEPMNEARCENIVARGGNDFSDYVIPEMTLPLQQAFGRLIRHREDRGVVAILDPRLATKGYGRGILRALPQARRVETLGEVQAFFAGLKEAV